MFTSKVDKIDAFFFFAPKFGFEIDHQLCGLKQHEHEHEQKCD